MLNKTNELIYHTSEQGSVAWLMERRGKVTGSSCAPLLSNPSKGAKGLSVGCWTLIYQLASDFITNPTLDPGYKSPKMERGNRLEHFARKAYELDQFEPVTEVGFIEVAGRLAGFSADGMVGTRRGMEIKCLDGPSHLKWLEEKAEGRTKIPTPHAAQVQWTIYCAGFEGWDLVHYHPDFPKDNGQLDIYPIAPDKKMQARFAEAFPLLEAEVKRIVGKYNAAALKAITNPLQLAA